VVGEAERWTLGWKILAISRELTRMNAIRSKPKKQNLKRSATQARKPKTRHVHQRRHGETREKINGFLPDRVVHLRFRTGPAECQYFQPISPDRKIGHGKKQSQEIRFADKIVASCEDFNDCTAEVARKQRIFGVVKRAQTFSLIERNPGLRTHTHQKPCSQPTSAFQVCF